MADFGDFDPDDALDHEAADPEQVARKVQEFRHREGLTLDHWDDLTDEQRAASIAVIAAVLAWLRRQGAHP